MTDHRPEPAALPDLTEAELVEFIRSVDLAAPVALHQRVQELLERESAGSRPRPGRVRPERSARGHGRWSGGGLVLSRLTWRWAGALAVPAAALTLLLGLPSGGSTPFSLRAASALTLAPANLAAPSQDSRRPDQLVADVGGVAFPYWEDSLGWRSTGARVDRLDGRRVTTVFYSDGHGRRVGYAIVAGRAAPPTAGGGLSWRHGVRYRLTSENGLPVVVWSRDGHLCVISGRDVNSGALLQLASDDSL